MITLKHGIKQIIKDNSLPKSFIDSEYDYFINYLLTTYYNNLTYRINNESVYEFTHPMVPVNGLNLNFNLEADSKFKPVSGITDYIKSF